MSYKMKVCFGKSWGKENPSPEEIERAIDELRPIKDNFIILESYQRIENCEFIQTVISRGSDPENSFGDDEIVYLVEVQFMYTEKQESGKSKKLEKGSFNQFAYRTSDVDEVKRMFRMFALGRVPDITSWNDITEEIYALIDKKEAD